jgi:hypothetical protein
VEPTNAWVWIVLSRYSDQKLGETCEQLAPLAQFRSYGTSGHWDAVEVVSDDGVQLVWVHRPVVVNSTWAAGVVL